MTSTGFTMLTDAESGRSLMIGLFATQADLDESLPALPAMTPPEGVGSMTSADVYEVVADSADVSLATARRARDGCGRKLA